MELAECLLGSEAANATQHSGFLRNDICGVPPSKKTSALAESLGTDGKLFPFGNTLSTISISEASESYEPSELNSLQEFWRCRASLPHMLRTIKSQKM